MKRIACLLMGFILYSRVTNAQEYYFRHYQVENGLSYSAVFCSAQDAAGFMWFGTRDGLNRFDGYNFKVYRHVAGDSLSLGSNFIYALHQEPAGGPLYVGTQKGLYRYDPQHECFHLVPGTAGKGVSDIQPDNRGMLWYIAGAELCRYDPATGRTLVYDPAHYFHATSVDKTADGTLWVSTDAGLLERYNHLTDSFTAYDLFAHSPPVASHWIDKLYCTSEGTILAGTGGQGVKLFDPATHQYRDILQYNEDKTAIFARDFVQTAPGEYWVGTESGLFILHPGDTQAPVHLRKEYGDPWSLSDNAIYTLCRDREGGVWLGTYFGGENYYAHPWTVFEKYFPDGGPHTLSGNIVREICPDNHGDLWIGTEDAGLNKLDPVTGRFTHYEHSDAPGSIAYSNIHGLCVLGNRLWIGTYEHGLDVLDIATGKVVKHYSAGPGTHALKSNFIVTFCRLRDGTLLIGTLLGLYRYNPATDDFTAVAAIPADGFVYSILEAKDGVVWVGTLNKGLYSYEPNGEKAQHYQPETGVPKTLPSASVNNIFEDSHNNIWVATEGGGLCRWDRGTHRFTSLTTAQGFPSNIVFKTLEDRRGKLWITTSKGLVEYDPTDGRVQVYTRANGLLNDQFNYNSGYRDSAGRLYFGSLKGMIRFQPDSFAQDSYSMPIRLTGFQVNGQDFVIHEPGDPLARSVSVTPGVVLRHDENSIGIDFAALGFTAPEMTEYQYKLEGYDKEWTVLKANRRIYYTQLPPGDYYLHVKAANNGGAWTQGFEPWHIRILPPFWKSPVAWCLYVLAVLLLAGYLLLSYHRRVERKNRRNMELLELEKEREIYKAKIEFFTNVAHEIRTPLTLIMGPMEKIMDQAEDMPGVKKNILIMERNTKRLIDLTTELLDFRRTETKEFSLNFVQTDINALLQDTVNSFLPMAEDRGLELSTTLPPETIQAFVDREALTKILYNLISNAVKFSAKQANVTLASDDKHLTVKVCNDGPEIPAAFRDRIFEPFFRIRETGKLRGSGIGLALARSLAQLHKGDITLQSSDGRRTVFVLVLPIHQEKEFGYTI